MRRYFYIKFPKNITLYRGIAFDTKKKLWYIEGSVPDDLKPYLLEGYYNHYYKNI